MIYQSPPADGSPLGPDDRINLRCAECGQMRTPIINPLIPNMILAVCDECWRRALMRTFATPAGDATTEPKEEGQER